MGRIGRCTGLGGLGTDGGSDVTLQERQSPCAHRNSDALGIVKGTPRATAETKDVRLELSKAKTGIDTYTLLYIN